LPQKGNGEGRIEASQQKLIRRQIRDKVSIQTLGDEGNQNLGRRPNRIEGEEKNALDSRYSRRRIIQGSRGVIKPQLKLDQIAGLVCRGEHQVEALGRPWPRERRKLKGWILKLESHRLHR